MSKGNIQVANAPNVNRDRTIAIATNADKALASQQKAEIVSQNLIRYLALDPTNIQGDGVDEPPQ